MWVGVGEGVLVGAQCAGLEPRVYGWNPDAGGSSLIAAKALLLLSGVGKLLVTHRLAAVDLSQVHLFVVVCGAGWGGVGASRTQGEKW